MNPRGGHGRSPVRWVRGQWEPGSSRRYHGMLVAACLGLTGCADRNATGTVPYRVPWHTVAGIVHDTAGVPLRGAAVSLYVEPATFRDAVTDEVGGFSFTDILGNAVLTVWKAGHEPWLKGVPVYANVDLDITLRADSTADTTNSLPLAHVVRSLVPHSAPPCDPARWDARAPCRSFVFNAPVTGDLVVTITALAGSVLDLTIVRVSDRGYLGYSDTAYPGGSPVGARASVTGGQAYEVRVNAYYTASLFDIEARFQSGSR